MKDKRRKLRENKGIVVVVKLEEQKLWERNRSIT